MKQTYVKIKYATEKQMASLLDMPVKLLRLLTKLGLPKFAKDKYIPLEAVRWYINYLRNEAVCNKIELRIGNKILKKEVIKKMRPK